VQVLHIVAGLRALGDDAILVAPEGSTILSGAEERGIPTRAIRFRGEADLGFIARFRKLIRDERPDLVHLHSRRGADTLGLLAARWAGVPTVLSRRVDNPERGWIARFKYGMCDRVIAISDGIREVLLGEGVAAGHVVTVRSAIDAEAVPTECGGWPEEIAGWLGPTETPPVVIAMAAQFIHRKGHDLLLDVAPGVIAQSPTARFLLFGRGPLEEQVRERVRAEGLDAYILIPGFRRDLPELLPCCDLMVHPARAEGLGIALLEAAAAGLPVISTRVGGIPEAVVSGRTGMLVESEDRGALTEALVRLVNDAELRREMGHEAQRWVRAERSIPAMVEGNRRVYEEVLTASRSGR